MILSQNLKKVLISSAALLMVAGVGAGTNMINVNAKRVRTHRVVHIHRHHKRHSRRNMHRYNVKRYRHLKKIHAFNSRKLRHKRNTHKYNLKHYKNASQKTSSNLLGSSNNIENKNKQYYETGAKNGLTFANDWLGTAKSGDVDMIHHLANNQYYHKGWINAEYPYAGSKSLSEDAYEALNNPSLGLYQSSIQYLRN